MNMELSISKIVLCLLTLPYGLRAQVVRWEIAKHHANQHLQTRSKGLTWEEIITNEKGKGGYFATVKIGSPGQDLVMQLDTASSDTWVPYAGASICKGITTSCSLGSFEPHDSNTFKEVARNEFEISYVDASYSNGDYFEDGLEIGGAVVQNLTMGLGMQTNIPYGLVGVGYAANEVSLPTRGKNYANLPVVMEREGLIKSVAYSLWLNDLGASTGNILFGGIDTGKFIGPLTKIDLIPDDKLNNYTHFVVSMSSLEATSPSGTDILTSPAGPIEVVLDSGTTLSYLPNDMAHKVWEEVGAEYQKIFDMAVLPCSHSIHPGYFSFGFAGSHGPRINVTMDELVVDLTNGDPPTFMSGPYEGELVCEFGIQNYSSGPYVLGDTFLRSAYVVYDLENHEVAIATTDFNSTSTNIVAFDSKSAAIPFATAAGKHDESAVPPFPISTTLVAAEGFQDGDDPSSGGDEDDAAGRIQVVFAPASVAVLFSMVKMLAVYI